MDSNISEIVAEFLGELARTKTDFVLVGGIAMLAYVEGRNTKDIDLIMTVADLQNIPGLVLTYQDRDFARASFHGLEIDVLKPENRLFDLIREKYITETEVGRAHIKIATPEGLVLLKLYALPSLYRQGDFARVALYETDITLLMQKYPVERAAVLSTLAPILSESDKQELDAILQDIEKRIRRFRERPSDYDA